jgi:hypothetical protein
MWTPALVTHDTCTCSRGSLRLSCLTPAPVDVNGPAVAHDTRGCSLQQAHSSSTTGASAGHVSRPVSCNRSICHAGQVRLSMMTLCPLSASDQPVSVGAAPVPRDRRGCHREQMRSLCVTPALVIVDGRPSDRWRSDCLHRQMRESNDTAPAFLAECPYVWLPSYGHRQEQTRLSTRTDAGANVTGTCACAVLQTFPPSRLPVNSQSPPEGPR